MSNFCKCSKCKQKSDMPAFLKKDGNFSRVCRNCNRREYTISKSSSKAKKGTRKELLERIHGRPLEILTRIG